MNAFDSHPSRVRVRAPLGARQNILTGRTQLGDERTEGRAHVFGDIQRNKGPHAVSPSRQARHALRP